MAGLYSDPLRALADFHTFFKLLWIYRDWRRVGDGYHELPFHRSALYDKLDKLVSAGLMLKRKDENGISYYRVISRRIVIPNFGAIELSDDMPLIYVFIDPLGDFMRQLKWNPDTVRVIVRRSEDADS